MISLTKIKIKYVFLTILTIFIVIQGCLTISCDDLKETCRIYYINESDTTLIMEQYFEACTEFELELKKNEFYDDLNELNLDTTVVITSDIGKIEYYLYECK